MTVSTVKTLVCLAWTICIVALFSTQNFRTASGQTKKPDEKAKLNRKPDDSLINSFDAAIQKRFLTEPYFGIRRIEPSYPTNPHLEYFNPMNDEERKSITDFESSGWKVFLYLYGKKTNHRVVDGKTKKDFVIDYRINQPVTITKNLEKKELPTGESLLKNVKEAFLAFQTPNAQNENNYEFSSGKWTYIARPVRAVNESCVKCHTDYVVTEKLKNNQFKFRKRQIGDANGVLVYGFAKAG